MVLPGRALLEQELAAGIEDVDGERQVQAAAVAVGGELLLHPHRPARLVHQDHLFRPRGLHVAPPREAGS